MANVAMVSNICDTNQLFEGLSARIDDRDIDHVELVESGVCILGLSENEIRNMFDDSDYGSGYWDDMHGIIKGSLVEDAPLPRESANW